MSGCWVYKFDPERYQCVQGRSFLTGLYKKHTGLVLNLLQPFHTVKDRKT